MVCEYCGKEFKPRWKGNKFCSNECSQEYMRKTRTTRRMQNCIVCGKPFLGEAYRKSKYCSMECRNADWHNAHAEYLSKPRKHSDAFYEKQKERKQKRELEKEQEKEQKQKRKLIKKLCVVLSKRAKQIDLKVCAECGELFAPKSQKQVCCCAECSRKHDNRRRDNRIYQNGKPDLSISLTKLYMRDMGVCALCGRKIDFDCDINSDRYPSIDHIVPLSKGGKHSWDNVQLACRICNSMKSNKI